MFSQNNEEMYILDYFKDKVGVFLDIGAYNGIKFSNTYALYQKGWGGVVIEPSPIVFASLFGLYRDKDNIRLVNVAVGKNSELIAFYDTNGDAISSSNLAHIDLWVRKANVHFSKIYIKTVTISEILDKFGYDFDFINLDVEGMNYELFLTIPFEKLTNLSMLCIEHDNKISEILDKMKCYGFRELVRNPENLILVK
jgi:FkbM family methyltransferase